MRYEAILFDFDGVLAETEPLHYRSWQEVLKILGITFDWEFYRLHGIGTSDNDLLALLATLTTPPQPLEALWRRYPLKQQLFLEMALAEPPIPATIRDFISTLNGYKLAVVTSTGRKEIEPLLEAAGLLPAFDALVCAEDVPRHKPDAAPYLEAARRLGVTRALVVEDSDAGVAAGRAAGFDVVRVGSVQEVPGAVRARLDGLA